MNYEELVKSLRCCTSSSPDDCDICAYQPFCQRNGTGRERIMIDSTAAIEALQAQLPKRGEWITHPEVKNIYGGVYIECPFCGEKYVVQNVSDEKFCRNCGADMRAKMEVQE